MAEVFISYSSADSIKAEDILNRLEGAGICCWISNRDIAPGADYAIEIPKAITACKYFVLLLTNAAQNSPYVMLELDQAFKQKKEILPILLEEVQENEKTNFFLNAKQKEDATKDLTGAINRIIAKIRPGTGNSQNFSGYSAAAKPSKPELIRCPHCGGEILKLKTAKIYDQIFVNNEGILTNRKISSREINQANYLNKRLEYIQVITAAITLGVSVFFTIYICSFFLNSEQKTPGMMPLFVFLLFCVAVSLAGAIICLFYRKNRETIYNFAKEKNGKLSTSIDFLLAGITNSRQKYYSFKCAKCEKDFCFLLHEDESVTDRVTSLIEEAAERKSGNIWDNLNFWEEEDYWDEE